MTIMNFLVIIYATLALCRVAGSSVTLESNKIRQSEFEGENEIIEQHQDRSLGNMFDNNSSNNNGNGGDIYPKRDITLTLSSSKSEFAANEPVVLTATLKNNESNKPVRILDWLNPCKDDAGVIDHTSSSPVDMSFFAIKTVNGGQEAPYLGASIKRGEPTDKDFKMLKAGEEISCTVSLDKYYQFAAPSSDNNYDIKYSVASMQLSNPFKTGGVNTFESLESNSLMVKINARTNPSRSLRDQSSSMMRGLQTGSTTFTSCAIDQQGLLREARKQALAASIEAVSFITQISQWGNTTSCRRHNEWFGTYSGSRLAELKPGYELIRSRLNDAVINFNCGCKQRAYAYVYPNRPYEITLCRAFWAAPMSGTDSKMGTVIHEMSHFIATANTNDYAYGQSTCRSLAISNPQNAVNNADSHEYFAENTPQLTCNPY